MAQGQQEVPKPQNRRPFSTLLLQESHDWVFPDPDPDPAPALPLVRRPWTIPRLQIQDRRLRRTYLGQLDSVLRPEQAVGPFGVRRPPAGLS